ncbi:MAG TPA: YceI family protein [Vicinamibacteria bacterium]|nr:YceI family protein [Vicinamibacteria bacterium]
MLNFQRPRAAALAMAAALFTLPGPATAAETFVVDTPHSEAAFQVRHFVTKVRGRFNDFGGTILVDRANPAASSVELKINAASLDTAHAGRDKHLRSADFFDVEKHPEITFRSSQIVPRGQDRYDVTGTFTLHGVTREITVPVTFLGFMGSGPGEKAGFSADFTLDRKDYGIVWNRVLDTGGAVLGDEVFISVNVEANPPKPPPPATPATR